MSNGPNARPARPGLRPWTQIRWVDDATWHRFLGIAATRNVAVGKLLSAVLGDWLTAGDRAAREPCPRCGHTWRDCRGSDA